MFIVTMWRVESLDEISDIQETMLERQPCHGVYSLEYPQGNTGYFYFVAVDGYYNATSIGKDIFDKTWRVLNFDDQPHLDS